MSEFIDCLPSFTRLKREVRELQRDQQHLEQAERKMRHCFVKVVIDILLMFYQNIEQPLRHMYREHVLDLALDFYSRIPEDVVKTVKKEMEESMNRAENERPHRGFSTFVDDNSFLNESGIMLFDSRDGYLAHLKSEQHRLRLLSLGCSVSLFIS